MNWQHDDTQPLPQPIAVEGHLDNGGRRAVLAVTVVALFALTLGAGTVLFATYQLASALDHAIPMCREAK